LMGTEAVERASSDMSDSDAIRWDPDVHARGITRAFVVDDTRSFVVVYESF